MQKTKGRILEAHEVVDMEFPTFGPITEETKRKNRGLFGAREIYTDEEFAARRERVGKKRLPYSNDVSSLKGVKK